MPDFYAPEFEDWCDHVAREYCATMADDPKLIGYFYMDCPSWVHTHPHSRWRGPMYDFRKLETERGRKELFDPATRYYKVTHDAVRRYDKHHLIFGDRYEGRGRMAKEVLMAAKPWADVPDGRHEVTVHFAEVLGQKARERLTYNLGVDLDAMATNGQRQFHLKVNGEIVRLDIRLIDYQATALRIPVLARDEAGITIEIVPVVGSAMISAVEIEGL